MADVKRPQRRPRGADTLGTTVNVEVGVPAYHDYRQGASDKSDAMRIRRGSAPEAPVGAGKGFQGID